MADDDDINIFEEFYDSIKPGGMFDQRALDIAKGATDILTPNQQTQAEMDAYNQQRQDALNFLYSASGVDPESFQGKALESQFRQNKELQKLLGFDSNMLKELKYDFAKAGQFLFGDANVGLTSMKEQGTKFKDLPFEQKFGIAMLPIDALDIIGLGVLAKGGLSPLIKTGMKVYGKKSGKTIQDLLSDEQVLSKIETEQPGFLKQLKELGIPIEARFASGPPKKTFTPKLMGRDPLGLLDDSEFGMGTGQSAFRKNLPSQLEVDDKLKRAALEAQELKKETDKLKKVKVLEDTFEGRAPTDPAPVIKKKNLEEFSKAYDYAMTKGKMTSSYLKNMRNKYKNFDELLEESVKKGLTKRRNVAPSGKIFTEAGEDWLRENYANMSTDEIFKEMTKNPENIEKYFFTDKQGIPRYEGKDKDAIFRTLPNETLGVLKTPETKARTNPTVTKAEENRQGIYDAFETKLDAENFDSSKLENIRLAFSEAFLEKHKTSKYVDLISDPSSTDYNYLRQLNDMMQFYNKSKGFGKFDKTKIEPGRVYNKDEIAKIDKYLAVGDNKKPRAILTSEFRTYLTGNDTFKNLVKNMPDLDRKKFYHLKVDKANKIKRYLNFIRESSPETRKPVNKDFGAFMEKFDLDIQALLDPTSTQFRDFQNFAYYDKVREQVQELVVPFLDKRFPVDEGMKPGTSSIQIAHTFETSRIGDTLPKGLEGAGMIPGTFYLDISHLNALTQPGIEAEARAAVKKFRETGDMSSIDKVSAKLENIGAETTIDEFTIGKHKSLEEKLFDLMEAPNSKERKLLQEAYNITDEEIENVMKAIDILNNSARQLGVAQMQSGGLVGDVDDIFEEEDEIMKAKKGVFPRISVEFGDAARGTKRTFGDVKPEEDVFNLEQKTSAAPMQRTFDVQPTENIFTGEIEQANLKLPFWKLFTKPPVNETAPIPTPKENLDNPTKKQKQSLEQEKINKQDDVFDPTPEDNDKVNLVDDVTGMDIAVTPKTKQPITGVFYSDIERVLARPDTPEIFINKKALLDFFRKNRIRDSEFRDYQIESLLRIYDENTPIPKQQVIDHLRQSPIRGMHVHATGQGSEIINPYGEKPTAYSGYAEPGYISGTQRERVLYIPNEKIPGDSGSYPVGIFEGESISNHAFGIPDKDNVYVVGWSRLTDRNAILPTKISAPKTASNIPGLTRERERAQRQVAGLFAEAINKLNREGVRRGLSQGELDELSQLSLEQIMTQYGDTLNQLSPGLLDQIDELIVKVRDIDDQITKGSNIDTSGIVRVAFADEIQSDIMQAAAARKQKLVATLRKIQDEGRESTTLPQLSRIGNQALEFFEENKSVFRPLKRSQTEVDLIGEKLVKLDAEVDEIINRYIDTRELDPASVTRLKEALTQNIDEMINELIVIDSRTYDGLFPDIPFKKREEWADAIIKKDLFELAYRKFVLKEENVPEYYAVTPDQFVIDRYNFRGNSATPLDVRAADKKKQIDYFTARGEFLGSEYKGIGMSEFYGGPNAKTPDGKHYTSTIEKILKTQAKSNNSELVVLNVQTKAGAKDIFRITDQNGNMVATLSNRAQAETVINNNPNYRMERVSVPTDKNTTPSFAIKITEEMLEPYKTHKAKGGLVEMIDIFEVA